MGFVHDGLGGIFSIAIPRPQNTIRLSVFLGVSAASQTLVILSGGEGIDLSLGAVVTLTAILSYVIVNGRDSMVIPALFAALLVGAAIGLRRRKQGFA